jgi:hypothetical protein
MTEEKPLPQVIIIFMIFTGLFFDLVSLIPFANIIIVPIAHGVFWYWFRGYGIQYFDRKKMKSKIAATIIEFIPVISVIPAWTLIVVITLVQSKLLTGVKVPAVAKAVVTKKPNLGV